MRSPQSLFLERRAEAVAQARDGDAVPSPIDALKASGRVDFVRVDSVIRRDRVTGAPLFRTNHMPLHMDRRLSRGNVERMVKVVR